MNKLKKNSILGKIILIIISLFLGVSLISINYIAIGRSANVEGFNVYGLTADFTGEGTWNCPSANSITGTVYGTTSSGCTGTSNKEQSSTLKLIYNDSLLCNFSFDYESTISDGKFTIDGNEKSGTGKFEKALNNGDSVSLVISSNTPKAPTTVNIKNITCKIDKKITITFLPSVNGNYTYNGDIISEAITTETDASTEFTLRATPNDGYSFNGWEFNGLIYSKDNPYKGTYSQDATITAIFVRENSPIFLNNNKEFYDLHDALNSANSNTDKKIILSKSGTVFSSLNNNYEFTSGIQLLIPYDISYSMNTGENEKDLPLENSIGRSKPEFKYELFLEDEVRLEFGNNSVCYIASKGWCATGGENGAGSPTVASGHIKLLGAKSQIVMKEGSKMFAYGYITGEGSVIMDNNSAINEFFQIADFKGGTNTSSCLRKVFPFNQLYIQNIECNIVYNGNVTEKVMTGFNVKIFGDVKTIFPFISSLNNTNESGLFKLSDDASLERQYDGSKDRICYTLKSGKANLSSISLSVAGKSVNSADYKLPIPSNMSIVIGSGTSVNINQDLLFLPGSKLIVEEGATLNISENKKIYLYDKNSWINKKYSANRKDLVTIYYSPTKSYERTAQDLANAELYINGIINVGNKAGIYTTNASGNYANVFSSNGTGKIIFNSELENSVTDNQFNWDNGVETNTLYPLYLRNSVNEIENSNDSYCYLFDEKPLAGNVIYFDITLNKWMKKSNMTSSYTINFLDQNDVSVKVSKIYTTGDKFIFPTSDDELFNAFKYKDYKVKKWKIEGVGIYNAGQEYTLTSSINLDAYALYGGWTDLDGEKYYIDYETGEYYKGLKKVDYNNEIKICKFKEDGAFDLGYTGTYLNPVDNKYYFIESGVVKEKGFYKYASSLTSNDYNYVFVSDDNTLLKGGTYYVNDDQKSSILPSGTYNFDENGLIIKEDKDASSYDEDNVYIKNIDNKGDSAFINGIRVGIGLFKDGKYLKYADSTGFIVKNTTYYVSKTNNISGINEGLYYFDNEGRMYDENFILIEAK